MRVYDAVRMAKVGLTKSLILLEKLPIHPPISVPPELLRCCEPWASYQGIASAIPKLL